MVGGLVYGAWHRSVAAFWLLGGLALVNRTGRAWPPTCRGRRAAFVSGLFCAPAITATVDTVSRLVPLSARGEAIGWHGSSMTLGIALGAPLAGSRSTRGLAVGLRRGQRGRPPRGRRLRQASSAGAGDGEPTPVDDSRLRDGALISWWGEPDRPVRSGSSSRVGPSVVQEKSSASTRADREIAGSYGSGHGPAEGFLVATRHPCRVTGSVPGCCAGHGGCGLDAPYLKLLAHPR